MSRSPSNRWLLFLLLASFALSLPYEAQAAPGQPGILASLLKWTPLIFKGFLLNLLASVLSMALGSLLGAFLGLAQISPNRFVAKSAWAVTQFFRNAPWLVLLFYTVLLIPFEIRISGGSIPLPDTAKAILGLALPVMGNVSEIVRGAVQSVPSGQWESAQALAFTRRQTLWMIILPQCLKRMLPPWMNLYAVLTMATPLISIVGVEEAMTMTRAALAAENRSELLVPMYGMLLVWFYLYCAPIAAWTKRLEKRFGVKA